MARDEYVRVRNWGKYQHYKDGRPVRWIKLWLEILDDYGVANLPDSWKWHLVGVLLLAAKHGNRIPADADWITRRINASEPVELARLLEAGFVEPCESVPIRTNPYQIEPDSSSSLYNSCSKGEGGSEGERERDLDPKVSRQFERACRVFADEPDYTWLTEQIGRDRYSGIDWEYELEKLSDYWQKPPPGRKRRNLKNAIHNWMRNAAKDYAATSQKANQPSKESPHLAPTEIKCKECGESFNNRSHQRAHYRDRHPEAA